MSDNSTEIIASLIADFKNENPDIRERAVVQVLDYGADAVEPLMEALDSDNANVRHMAVWALGEIGDMRSVQPLIKRLTDDDER
ncbi:MAG: HEAT repeat domain-containing protein, partial [Chloroflexota bacterium]